MNTLNIVKYGFAAIGAAMLVGALAMAQNTRAFLADATHARGTVIDLEPRRSSDSLTYAPVIEFVTADQQLVSFATNHSSSHPSEAIGDPVEVVYAADRPEDARLVGFFALWGGVLICGGLGALFLLIGGSVIVYGQLAGRKQKHLREHGRRIDTRLQSVERNTALLVNGRHPFQLVTQWLDPATNQVRVFRSNNIWFDPSDYVGDDEVPVYVDPKDPGRYLVDLSFLPEPAH